VDQELLARNEYLAAENRILKAQLKGRLKLSDAERATLGEIGYRLEPLPKSQLWRGRILSRPGTASLSPASPMARKPGNDVDVHGRDVCDSRPQPPESLRRELPVDHHRP
jgi:hypothetical protein